MSATGAAAGQGTGTAAAVAGNDAGTGAGTQQGQQQQGQQSGQQQGGQGGEQKPKRGEKRGAEAAMDRVVATRAAAKKDSEAGSGEQAPGAGDGKGASTQDAGADGKAKEGKEGAGADAGKDAGAQGSTPTPPDDWPQAQKDRFAALPSDEDRKLVLEFHQDMARGLHESFQKLAQLKKGHEGLFEVMKEQGVDADEVRRVLGISAEFQKEPRKVLQRLAAEQGIELFFERPAAIGEIPEFKDAAQMAKWVAEETQRQMSAKLEADKKAESGKAEVEKAKSVLRKEVEDASKAHGKDWETHRTAVFEKIAQVPGLSVEDAFSLVTLPNLRKLAEESQKAKNDLVAAQAELEKARKAATQPPAGGSGDQKTDGKGKSKGERAFDKASAKRAARAHA